jgi:hypothetical protein
MLVTNLNSGQICPRINSALFWDAFRIIPVRETQQGNASSFIKAKLVSAASVSRWIRQTRVPLQFSAHPVSQLGFCSHWTPPFYRPLEICYTQGAIVWMRATRRELYTVLSGEFSGNSTCLLGILDLNYLLIFYNFPHWKSFDNSKHRDKTSSDTQNCLLLTEFTQASHHNNSSESDWPLNFL